MCLPSDKFLKLIPKNNSTFESNKKILENNL